MIEKTNIIQFNSLAEVWRCPTKKVLRNWKFCKIYTKKYVQESSEITSLLIKKTHVFSYEFCEVFKNTFLVEHLLLGFLKVIFSCGSIRPSYFKKN